MTIRFNCLACRQPMQADKSEIGRKIACENCGLRFPVPRGADRTMWIAIGVVLAVILLTLLLIGGGVYYMLSIRMNYLVLMGGW